MQRVFHFVIIGAILLMSCARTKDDVMLKTPKKCFHYSNKEFINYEVVGSGPCPVLFLHGFGASLRNWDDVLPLLPQQNMTAFLLDLKGAGLSSKPHDDQYSIKDNADIVCRFIQEKQLKNYWLVGHSLGGGVALLVALDAVSHGNKPKGMILIDSASYRTELPFFVRYLRIPFLNHMLLAFSSSDFKARYTLERIVYDRRSISPELVARYAIFMNQKGYDYALIKTAKDIIPDKFEELAQKYPSIQCPVLIIWGKNDTALPLSSGARLASELPNAKLHVIEKCGHNPHEEYPGTIANLISSFIRLKGD